MYDIVFDMGFNLKMFSGVSPFGINLKFAREIKNFNIYLYLKIINNNLNLFN
jgi:hypothetical protein